MTDHDVRPARRRDLDDLGLEDPDGLAFVMVAGDPVASYVHVALPGGHAHLTHLSAPGPAVGAALVDAVAERLAARGVGQVTALTQKDGPWDREWYARLGFADVDSEEPLPGTLLSVREEEEASPGRVLVRRTLRRHRTTEDLTGFLPTLDAQPSDVGTLRLVVRRPALGERELLEEGRLDVADGLVGDTWRDRGSRRTDDGSAHPDMQLNLMSHALVEFLAQDPDREVLAGDQMFVDLDLSHDNLPAWSELHIGGPDGAVIVVTDQPHNGCGKFIARYGKDAMSFVNGPEGKPRRLRGLCAKVARPGPVRPGDAVVVVRPGA